MNKASIISQVESLSKTYSDRFLEGTKIGMAVMKVLGFHRSDYTVDTPEDRKRGGWKATRIWVKDFKVGSLFAKVIKYREIFADCGFNVHIHVLDGKLFMIWIEETVSREATVVISRRVTGGDTVWTTIYSNSQYLYY